jgi:hypothetical protein
MDNRWFILFAAGLGIIVAAGLWGSSYYNKQILVVETPLFQPLPGAATMPPKVKRSLMVKIPAVVTTLLLAPSYMAFSSTGDAPDAEPTWAERRLGEGLDAVLWLISRTRWRGKRFRQPRRWRMSAVEAQDSP